jgi:molybdate transport system ATP-binding protein
VAGPRALLLDEPFAALDASARVALRRLVAEHLVAVAGPRMIVTHDPVEALTLGDRVVVMEAGRVVQEGTAAEIRAQPRVRYVADLLGVNLLHGVHSGDTFALRDGGTLVVADHAAVGRSAVALIHPRAVALHTEEPHGSPRNTWLATVVSLDDDGSRVRVALEGPVPLVAEITQRAGHALGLRPGATVWLALKATDITLQDA